MGHRRRALEDCKGTGGSCGECPNTTRQACVQLQGDRNRRAGVLFPRRPPRAGGSLPERNVVLIVRAPVSPPGSLPPRHVRIWALKLNRESPARVVAANETVQDIHDHRQAPGGQ